MSAAGLGRARATALTLGVCVPLVGGAAWLWAERGWLILIDLANISTHAFCL